MLLTKPANEISSSREAIDFCFAEWFVYAAAAQRQHADVLSAESEYEADFVRNAGGGVMPAIIFGLQEVVRRQSPHEDEARFWIDPDSVVEWVENIGAREILIDDDVAIGDALFVVEVEGMPICPIVESIHHLKWRQEMQGGLEPLWKRIRPNAAQNRAQKVVPSGEGPHIPHN